MMIHPENSVNHKVAVVINTNNNDEWPTSNNKGLILKEFKNAQLSQNEEKLTEKPPHRLSINYKLLPRASMFASTKLSVCNRLKVIDMRRSSDFNNSSNRSSSQISRNDQHRSLNQIQIRKEIGSYVVNSSSHGLLKQKRKSRAYNDFTKLRYILSSTIFSM